MSNFGVRKINKSNGRLDNLQQRLTHETSLTVQKKHPEFKEHKELTTINLEKLKVNLIEQGLTTEEHFKVAVLDKMKEVMRLLFLSVKGKLDARFGCFEIFGVDFLLGADLSPRVMEVTSNPSFTTEMSGSYPVVRQLIRDVITITSELHEKNIGMARQATLERAFLCASQPYDVLHQESGSNLPIETKTTK